MSTSKQSMLKELQSNTRLRVGLWLIAGIIAIYGILLLDDQRLKLQGEYKTTVARLHQLENIAQQADWTKRADEIKKLRQDLESKLWQANTQGLAEANLQAWFDKQLKELEINVQRLKVESVVESQPTMKLWKVTAHIGAKFVPKQFDGLLLAMAKNPQWLIIERLDVFGANRNPRFVIIASAYFQAKNEDKKS